MLGLIRRTSAVLCTMLVPILLYPDLIFPVRFGVMHARYFVYYLDGKNCNFLMKAPLLARRPWVHYLAARQPAGKRPGADRSMATVCSFGGDGPIWPQTHTYTSFSFPQGFAHAIPFMFVVRDRVCRRPLRKRSRNRKVV